MEYHEDYIGLSQLEMQKERVQDNLMCLTLSMASLYCKLCQVNGELPDKHLEDLAQLGCEVTQDSFQEQQQSGRDSNADSAVSYDCEADSSKYYNSPECLNIINYVSHQVILCKNIIENSMKETSCSLIVSTSLSSVETDPQIERLKADACIYRQTQMYETEKEIMAETISRLSTELQTLKMEIDNLNTKCHELSNNCDTSLKCIVDLQSRITCTEGANKSLVHEKQQLLQMLEKLKAEPTAITKSIDSEDVTDSKILRPTDGIPKRPYKPPPWSYYSKRSLVNLKL